MQHDTALSPITPSAGPGTNDPQHSATTSGPVAGAASSVRWSVAVTASRENPDTLAATLDAILVALHGNCAVVDLLVNGNPALARECADLAGALRRLGEGQQVRVWSIAAGDKANAWNQYMHALWPGSDVGFFVDGYARPAEDALERLAGDLHRNRHVLSATGVPGYGRSAARLRQQLLAEGGVHGNLFAVRGQVITAFRERGFRVPIGMYRVDSLLGAVLAFGLDPSRSQWDRSRLYVDPDVTWHAPTLSMFRPADVRTQLRRVMRQSRGVLETRAVREHLAVRKRLPESLPTTNSELVMSWLQSSAARRLEVLRLSPLSLLTIREVRNAPRFEPQDLVAELVAAW